MIKVVLLGSGNVAYHLALALKKAARISVVQRYSRTGRNDEVFDPNIPVTHNLKDLKEADIYIIAVKDSAIHSLSAQLNTIDGLVVHTSGSIPLTHLSEGLRRGVLYPAQSLTLKQSVDFDEIPLVIEAESNHDQTLLQNIASTLSKKVYSLNSLQREKLHISAIFANNFSNYMFTCAESICKEADIPFDILKPIILETGKKIQQLDPLEAQTGPARRNDQLIIEKHLKDLDGDKKSIYKTISNAITNTYTKND